MMLINAYVPLLLRICVVVLFPFSGLDKILNWNSAMKQAGNVPFKPAMLVASIVVEFAAPGCIVTGWHDRLAAFILAGFCVITAVLFHQFWRFPDFWRFQGRRGPGTFLGVPEEFRLGRRPRPDHAGAADIAAQRGRAISARLDPCDRASGRQPGHAGALIDQHQAVAVGVLHWTG